MRERPNIKAWELANYRFHTDRNMIHIVFDKKFSDVDEFNS